MSKLNERYHMFVGGLNIAFSLVYEIPVEGLGAAERIAADWQFKCGKNAKMARFDTVDENNVRLSLFQPAESFSKKRGESVKKFVILLENEDWCEFYIGRFPYSTISVAAYREKRTVVVDGETVELDGVPFGFDADTARDTKQNIIKLRDYRPHTSSEWQGFAPLYFKIKNNGAELYYRVSLEWGTENDRQFLQVLGTRLFEIGAAPESLRALTL